MLVMITLLRMSLMLLSVASKIAVDMSLFVYDFAYLHST